MYEQEQPGPRGHGQERAELDRDLLQQSMQNQVVQVVNNEDSMTDTKGSCEGEVPSSI